MNKLLIISIAFIIVIAGFQIAHNKQIKNYNDISNDYIKIDKFSVSTPDIYAFVYNNKETGIAEFYSVTKDKFYKDGVEYYIVTKDVFTPRGILNVYLEDEQKRLNTYSQLNEEVKK